jgi:hypothetical protein
MPHRWSRTRCNFQPDSDSADSADCPSGDRSSVANATQTFAREAMPSGATAGPTWRHERRPDRKSAAVPSPVVSSLLASRQRAGVAPTVQRCRAALSESRSRTRGRARPQCGDQPSCDRVTSQRAGGRAPSPKNGTKRTAINERSSKQSSLVPALMRRYNISSWPSLWRPTGMIRRPPTAS